MSRLGEAARFLHQLGWRVFPLKPRSKVPLTITWTPYQQRQATEAELVEWWRGEPDANIGIAMGSYADAFNGWSVFALDLDSAEARGELEAAIGIELPETLRVATRAGREQAYYVHTEPFHNGAALGGLKIDVRGQGGYVVAPPSIHPDTGEPYRWVNEGTTMAQAPGELIAWLTKHLGPKQRETDEPADDWVSRFYSEGIAEGSRDSDLTRLAGYLLSKGMAREIVESMMQNFNETQVRPPLSAWQVKKIVRSVAKREYARETERARVADGEEMLQCGGKRVELLDYIRTPPPVIATPFTELNALLGGGLRRGELMYLGAGPAVGKSALALQVAEYAARTGIVTLYVSLEMTVKSLQMRMIQQRARITRRLLHSNDGITIADAVMRGFAALPLYFASRDVYTVEAIAKSADLLKEQTGQALDLIVLDYIQHTRSTKPHRDRRLEIEEVSRDLKKLTLDRNLCALAISSLRRPDKKNDYEPTMRDLRESGNLEYDADAVLLLKRVTEDESVIDSQMKATGILAKNRDGMCGRFELIFEGQYVLFADAMVEVPL